MSRLFPARALLAALLSLTALVACTKDSAEPLDSVPEVEEEKDPVILDCVLPPVETPISDGVWAVGIDEALFNHCENQAGKGLHIHVNEATMLEIDASSYPELSAISDPSSQAMTMTGSQDGASFELVGNVELEIGTCIIGIEATMTGQMTGEQSFCYQMDATASIAEELSPDACSLILGETANHTFSELPCDQAWVGVAQPAPQ